MKLLVVGSTGGTGREIVRQALEQGHHVTAFARNPKDVTIHHDRLTVVQGNVLDPGTVERAVQGHDAVLSALGHKRFFLPTSILSTGTANIINAMNKHGVRRFICETTLGISDSRGKLGLYYSLFVIPVITFWYFRDKVKQERLIKESGLDWTIVRPGQLTNGKQRGSYHHGPGVGSFFITVSISRADVADFMLKQLTDRQYLHQTPGVAN